MKKIILTLFLSLIWVSYAPANETEWEGKCYIQFEGELLVDNEICKMSSSDMPIDDKDYFLVTAQEDGLWDVHTSGCAYFFYAQQFKLLGKYFWEASFNVSKEINKAQYYIRPMDIDLYFIPGYDGSGVCFIKDEDKFCFEY